MCKKNRERKDVLCADICCRTKAAENGSWPINVVASSIPPFLAISEAHVPFNKLNSSCFSSKSSFFFTYYFLPEGPKLTKPFFEKYPFPIIAKEPEKICAL